MESVNLNAIKSFGLNDLFLGPPEEQKEVLCRCRLIDSEIEARADSFTIVLDRDIIRSVENASEIAVFLAKKFPNRRILLINTYAGTNLLQRSLVLGLMAAGIKLPATLQPFYPQIHKDAFDENVVEPFPENLRLMNCPTSTLTAWRLDSELTIHGYEIVLINSFEFAALTHYAKSVLARGLLELQKKRSLAVILFSQEWRGDVSAYAVARGPIGMLSAYSSAVWRVYSNYEIQNGY